MKWKDIETRIDNGERNLVYITKPTGITFRVYNYSENCRVNSILCLFDVWGKKASCPFNYKGKFGVEGYELPIGIYNFFKTNAMCVAFARLGVVLFFEEALEE